MNQYLAIPWIILAIALLSGCAGAMRSYDNELKQTINHIDKGQVDSSLVALEQNNTSKDKDLLYYFEKGEMLQLKKDYVNSYESWRFADEKIRVWEDEVRASPDKVLGNVGSVIVNDKTRRYDGRDYEKVFLQTNLALTHIYQGDWNSARIEIKKMHEREAFIADIRGKEIAKAEEKASEKGVSTTYKDLKGYPIESLDDPEVTKLKNSYQSAYGHYLSGFIYETLGEKGLAAAGYRQAIELRPDVPFLEQALKNLDTKKKSKSLTTDVLFIVESGYAPAFKSMSIPIPLPIGSVLTVTSLSFPIVQDQSLAFNPSSLTVNNVSVPLSTITNVNLMARRALKDEMPAIIVRGAVRAISKAVAQKAISDNDQSGGLATIAFMIGGMVLEGADERSWRTLPEKVSVGRMSLAPGKYTVLVDTPSGPKSEVFDISGKAAVAALRISGSTIFTAQSAPLAPNLIAEIESSEKLADNPEPVIEKPFVKVKKKAKPQTVKKKPIS